MDTNVMCALILFILGKISQIWIHIYINKIIWILHYHNINNLRYCGSSPNVSTIVSVLNFFAGGPSHNMDNIKKY